MKGRLFRASPSREDQNLIYKQVRFLGKNRIGCDSLGRNTSQDSLQNSLEW